MNFLFKAYYPFFDSELECVENLNSIYKTENNIVLYTYYRLSRARVKPIFGGRSMYFFVFWFSITFISMLNWISIEKKKNFRYFYF